MKSGLRGRCLGGELWRANLVRAVLAGWEIWAGGDSVGWRVGQGSGVRGSGDQGEQSGSGVGWGGGKGLKIWRSRNTETSY